MEPTWRNPECKDWVLVKTGERCNLNYGHHGRCVYVKDTKYMAHIITIPIWIEDGKRPPDGYLFRLDGRVERTCEHGVGHTIAVRPKIFDFQSWKDNWGVHGCDGCCD